MGSWANPFSSQQHCPQLEKRGWVVGESDPLWFPPALNPVYCRSVWHDDFSCWAEILRMPQRCVSLGKSLSCDSVCPV